MIPTDNSNRAAAEPENSELSLEEAIKDYREMSAQKSKQPDIVIRTTTEKYINCADLPGLDFPQTQWSAAERARFMAKMKRYFEREEGKEPDSTKSK